MAMVAMDMEVMVIMATTARERLSQLPLLKLMLSPGIIIMGMDTLMVDTAITVTTARGKQRLLLDTITMVMAMDMGDMDTMVTMARERLSQDIIIMVMDTMVNKQHLFISFQNSVTFIGTCWNLVKR